MITGTSIVIVGSGTGSLLRQATEAASLLGYANVRQSEEVPATDETVFVALDDVEARRAAIERLDPRRRVNLVHPSAVVSPSAHLADNIYIGAQSVIGVQATLGRGVVQNALSSIEHDNEIGAFTMLGTGSILCGHVTTGELAFIGGGSTIKPRTYVGARTTIGAGAVVINDTDDDAVYVGNPARRIR